MTGPHRFPSGSQFTARRRCAVFALALALPLAAQDGKPPMEGDGRSVFVRGLVTAEAKNLQRALARKDWVYEVDTLRTSDKAMARFVMRDHTMLSMTPGTQIALEQYQFKADASVQSKMVTNVVSGSLRALTGLVDKRDPDTVVLKTPLATAGVRGTALRVDLYPNGIEEIIFDFGHGYVRNQSGRVEVEPGFGARVISATILPELFKVERDETDPAQIALDLLGRKPPDLSVVPPLPNVPKEREEALALVSDQAAEVAKRMSEADQVLLLGMLEQVPNLDSPRTIAIIKGLLRTASAFDSELMLTSVHLVPERAPLVLEAAVLTGTPVRSALQAVAGALLPYWPPPLQPTTDAAIKLGLDPGEANRIIEEVRQSNPCRIEATPRPPDMAGDSANPGVEDIDCRPGEEMRHASHVPTPLLAFGTGTRRPA